MELKFETQIFGDLFTSRPSKRKIPEDEPVVFLGMEDVSEDGRILRQTQLPARFVKKGLTAFEKNDVLVAKITPCFENGKGAFVNTLETECGFGSTEFHVLRANKESSAGYIFQHTKSINFRNKLEGEMIGTAGQKRVPIRAIQEYELPVKHSFTEQNAIATALSDADALIESLEQLIHKKRNIKQGAMQELLTGKKRLPGFSGEWEVKRLGDLGSTFGGLTGKTKADFGEGSASYITFMNIMSNIVIDCDAFDQVNVSSSETQNKVAKSDLFFNGSSETPEEVGLCALLTEDVDDVYLNSFCFGFRFREPEKTNGMYLAYYFRSNEGRELLKSLAQGATRYNLSKTALLRVPFPLPSLDEQTAIATILSDMDAELTALEDKLAKAKAVKQGMMQELLTGRVRLV